MEKLLRPAKRVSKKSDNPIAVMDRFDKTNWKPVTFGDVCRNIQVAERDPLSVGIERYVGLEHIESSNLHIKSWGNVNEGTTFTKTFRAGQVLFGKRRAYLRKAAIAEFDGVCSGDILVFEAKGELIDPLLFPFLVQSDRFFDHAVKTSAGSLSPRTKFQDLSKFEFLLPPKDQQAKLAKLLWSAEVVEKFKIELLNKLILAQSVFALENFEDKKCLRVALSNIAEVNPRLPKSANDTDLEVSFLTMADVSEHGAILNHQIRKLGSVKKGFTYFGEGDTLFAKITPCMENGKGALARGLSNGIGFGSTEFHVIRPRSNSDEKYCFYLTQMEIFRREAEKFMVGSAGQRRVPASFVENYSFHIPNPDSRRLFGEKMDQFEHCKNFAKAAISNSKDLKESLINQIFG